MTMSLLKILQSIKRKNIIVVLSEQLYEPHNHKIFIFLEQVFCQHFFQVY